MGKIKLLLGASILLFVSVFSVAANAATVDWDSSTADWDLTFYDSDGSISGSGFFGYDLSTEDIIPLGPCPTCGSVVVSTRITHGLISLYDVEDFHFPFYQWWNDTTPEATLTAGSLWTRTTGLFSLRDFWFFGNPSGLPQLRLDFESEFSTNGSYNFAGSPSGFSGTWTASPVPIPGAAWLFGTALVGLVGFTKRRKAA